MLLLFFSFCAVVLVGEHDVDGYRQDAGSRCSFSILCILSKSRKQVLLVWGSLVPYLAITLLLLSLCLNLLADLVSLFQITGKKIA